MKGVLTFAQHAPLSGNFNLLGCGILLTAIFNPNEIECSGFCDFKGKTKKGFDTQKDAYPLQTQYFH